MMDILSIENLNKKYDKFELKNVSFKMKKGCIMGFIGRNGAGKTTTIKAVLNLVHPDSGKIAVLGNCTACNDPALKQKVAFMLGGVDYYPKQKLKAITNVIKRFYDEWDESAYKTYMEKFELDPGKRIDELSSGMKVKYALALALSHKAELLIFDEPTSGLDPVSRDDLLDLFQETVKDGDKSILFSTQITCDLEKCADFITYIKKGEIVVSTDRESFLGSYRIVRGTDEQLNEEVLQKLIGYRQESTGFTGLIKTGDLPDRNKLEVFPADIESIMIYFEKWHKKGA